MTNMPTTPPPIAPPSAVAKKSCGTKAEISAATTKPTSSERPMSSGSVTKP